VAFANSAKITIDHTKVPNTDQTNFPVLIRGTYAGGGTDPDLRSTGNGGRVASASGYDIYFYSDAALTTRLAAERVVWNASTGEFEAWVKIPVLSHTADTVIYLAFGDASVSTDPNADATYGKAGTWSNGFVGVYHFGDGASLSVADSSGNGFDLTTVGALTAVAGQVEGGVGSFGTGKHLSVPAGMTRLSGHLSVSAWIKPTALTNTGAVLSDWSSSHRDWYLISAGSQIRCLVGNGSNSQDADLIAGTTSTTAWKLYHFDINGTTHKLYENGSQVATQTGSFSGGVTTNTRNIGDDDTTSTPYQGSLDEVRFSNTNRSADWYATEYNNQSSPATFYTITFIVNTILATSTVTGSLVSPQRGITPAVVSATSTMSGAVRAKKKISGVVAATSTASGTLNAKHKLVVAVVAATSALSGVLAGKRSLPAGAVQAVVVVSGNVGVIRPLLVMQIDAVTTMNAELHGLYVIHPGNIVAFTYVSGSVGALRPIIMDEVFATSTMEGATIAYKAVAGQVSATSAVGGELVALRDILPAQIEAYAALSGDIEIKQFIEGAIQAVSSVEGKVVKEVRIGSSIFATSTLTGVGFTRTIKQAQLLRPDIYTRILGAGAPPTLIGAGP
jgi:hypothetical protein